MLLRLHCNRQVRHSTTTLSSLSKRALLKQIDGGGLRGLVPAGMLEGVEDMIKKVAIDNELVGEDTKGNSVQVTKDTPFSVVLADYFDVVAGKFDCQTIRGITDHAGLIPAIRLTCAAVYTVSGKEAMSSLCVQAPVQAQLSRHTVGDAHLPWHVDVAIAPACHLHHRVAVCVICSGHQGQTGDSTTYK